MTVGFQDRPTGNARTKPQPYVFRCGAIAMMEDYDGLRLGCAAGNVVGNRDGEVDSADPAPCAPAPLGVPALNFRLTLGAGAWGEGRSLFVPVANPAEEKQIGVAAPRTHVKIERVAVREQVARLAEQRARAAVAHCGVAA